VRNIPGTGDLHIGIDDVPQCRAVLYTHQSLWTDSMRAGAHPPGAAALVLFTHPSHGTRGWPRLVWALNRSTRVLSMSSVHAKSLRRHGVRRSRVRVEIPGVDPALFTNHERSGRGRVVLNSAYYPRKAAETWLEVVRLLPQRDFVLLGRGWTESPHADVLGRLGNLECLEVAYEDYPDIYRTADVFLSTSTVEGGPMPLLEAMMSNVVPVVSATGFGPDVVDHGRTGYVFPVGAAPATIAELIERAYLLDTAVRPSVTHLTPERYAEAVWREIER
jgi:glycosyltransferase involved in cell wall biosynthesis